MITKGERAELKSIVRQQFKVLRAELLQREVEMLADVEDQIVEKYAVEDQQWTDMEFLVQEKVRECNRAINDVLYQSGYQKRAGSEKVWVQAPKWAPPKVNSDRIELRRHAHARIRAQVIEARLSLDRREADTLRSLAIGALESEEAQAFLTSIPMVEDLVPASRLAELEASLDSGEDGAQ